MPPGTQDTYVQLPNGSYVHIPANATPEQMTQFKERLRSFATTGDKKPVEETPGTTPVFGGGTGSTPGRPAAAGKQPEQEDWLQSRSRAFNEGATGSGTIPELLGKAGGLLKDFFVKKGPINTVSDFVGDLLDSQTAAVSKYGTGDYKRYVAAIPGVGPTLAQGEEEGGSKGLARDLGLLTGGAILSKAPEAVVDTTAMAKQTFQKIFDDPKMTMQHGTELMAQELSNQALSPRQFGENLQSGFDQIANQAGAAKREFIGRVTRENPALTVDYSNTLNALDTEVGNLQRLKAHNPELFVQGEAKDLTLRILERERESIRGRVAAIKKNLDQGNLAQADQLRSDLWNYKQQLDPSYASRIIGTLDKAVTDDIAKTLAGKDPKLAMEYLENSARYHELNNLGRMNTLKSVFGNNRVAPGRVMEAMMKAPEDSLAAVRSLYRDDPQAIANLRRQLFEEGVKTAGAKGIFKMQPSLVREVFGPQSDAVNQFIRLINRKSGGGQTLLRAIPGKAGALFRIAEAGGRPGITIKASEMAKILQSSEVARQFAHAMEMPAAAGPSAMMRQTLDRAMQALDIKPEMEAVPKRRRPLWAEERRTTPERRTAEGTSPTGTERREIGFIPSKNIKGGPDPMRMAVIDELKKEIAKLPEGNEERRVLQIRLDDYLKNPFDEPAGGKDFLREGRASTEKKLSREEAEEASRKRTEGRTQRFKDRRRQAEEDDE